MKICTLSVSFILLMSSCVSYHYHETEMENLKQADEQVIFKNSEENKALELKIKELEQSISNLRSENEHYKSIIKPYQDLSVAEVELKMAQDVTAKLEEESRIKNILDEQQRSEKIVKEKKENEQAIKEKEDNQRYAKIGLMPVSVTCSWLMTIDDGRNFFTPKLNIKLKNISHYPISESNLRVIFIDTQNNEIFSEVTQAFINKYYDSPLAVGYVKEAIFTGDKGFRAKPSSIPKLRADIYLIEYHLNKETYNIEINTTFLTSLPVNIDNY